ncbi:MAG: HEPN domain-containing protein [Planctomycetes bacterium]|nr:HEPN domain-containing protein [Planctomycetota bacterium]
MKDEYLLRWITKADNDLRVAEHEMCLSSEQRVTEAICFHCQQSVEKYLKSYLVSHNTDFGKTHNLEYLLKLCSQYDPALAQVNIGNLSYYAVEVRYPDDFYIPSSEEARECIEIAKHVKALVLERIQDKRSNEPPNPCA